MTFGLSFWKKVAVSTYLDVVYGTWTQWSHVWPQQTWGQRSFRGQWPLIQGFEKKNHCIHILRCIFMGLGHSDPWVVSHMWPQQTWGQRSSTGQWLWFNFWYGSNQILQWLQKYVIAKQARLVVWEPPSTLEWPWLSFRPCILNWDP